MVFSTGSLSIHLKEIIQGIDVPANSDILHPSASGFFFSCLKIHIIFVHKPVYNLQV